MANNDVQHLLDMLYEMIDGAKNAPLSSDRCILNRDEALDLLDEIRAQLPVELARAQELIRAKEDYVKAAKRDVERMMQQAELDAKAKVSETEVLTAARDRSREIIKRAEDRSLSRLVRSRDDRASGHHRACVEALRPRVCVHRAERNEDAPDVFGRAEACADAREH